MTIAMFPITVPAPHCKYEIKWTTEELMALRWLADTLNKIVQKDGHRNQDNAARAMTGLFKFTEYERKMHPLFHKLEEKLKKSTERCRELERRCESLELVINDGGICTDGSCAQCKSGEPCH